LITQVLFSEATTQPCIKSISLFLVHMSQNVQGFQGELLVFLENTWREMLGKLLTKVAEIPAILDAETLAKLPTNEVSSQELESGIS